MMSSAISAPFDQSAGVPARPSLLIVGGSTRAAAESARRAGWRPVCADLYADLDLQAVANILTVANYPTSLPDDVATVCAERWMYTGGLENHPEVIARLEQTLLARSCRLWGTPATQLPRFRDPRLVDELAELAGWQRPGRVSMPHSSPAAAGPTLHGRWLYKQSDRAGGLGVSWPEDSSSATATSSKDELHTGWLEEYISGPVCSAVYQLTEAGPLLIGTALQFPGEAAARAHGPFLFCAAISVDPETLAVGNPLLTVQFAALGQVLFKQGTRGLIGVDFVQTSGAPTLLEINPRYTATTELHELRQRVCALPVVSPDAATHLELATHRKGNRVLGKMVVYAGQPLIMPNVLDVIWQREPWEVPTVADLTPAQTPIPAGAPICTVYARAGSPQRCLQRLRRQAEWVQQQVASAGSSFGEPQS